MLFKNRKLMLAFAAAAFLAGGAPQAMAQNNTQDRAPDIPDITEQEIEEGLQEAENVISETTEDISEAMENLGDEAIEDVAQTPDQKADITLLNNIPYQERNAASSIIGESVYNMDGDIVGNVEDILLDESGQLETLVIGDGSYLSLGDKKVAVPYNKLHDKSSVGELIYPITDARIDQLPPYERFDHQNKLSLNKMLEGYVLASDGRKIAEIDDVVVSDQNITYIVASEVDMSNVGGRQVAIAFEGVDITRLEDRINILLTARQSENWQDLMASALQ